MIFRTGIIAVGAIGDCGERKFLKINTTIVAALCQEGDITFLVDYHRRVCKIGRTQPIIAFPATYVVGRCGVVRWQNLPIDFHIRTVGRSRGRLEEDISGFAISTLCRDEQDLTVALRGIRASALVAACGIASPVT